MVVFSGLPMMHDSKKEERLYEMKINRNQIKVPMKKNITKMKH